MSNLPTLGQDLLEVVDDARSILGPRDLDLRPTLVTIVTRSWLSGVPGRGVSSDSTLALPDYTKVAHMSEREIASSGGRYEQGTLLVGAITPQYRDSQGVLRGLTEAQLAPVVTSPAVQILYVLSGQDAGSGINGNYERIELRRDKRLRFMLVLGRDRSSPGP